MPLGIGAGGIATGNTDLSAYWRGRQVHYRET